MSFQVWEALSHKVVATFVVVQIIEVVALLTACFVIREKKGPGDQGARLSVTQLTENKL